MSDTLWNSEFERMLKRLKVMVAESVKYDLADDFVNQLVAAKLALAKAAETYEGYYHD